MGKVPSFLLDDGKALLEMGRAIDLLHELVGPETSPLPLPGKARSDVLNLVGIGIAIYGKLTGILDKSLHSEEHGISSFVARYSEQAIIGFRMLEQAAGEGWLVENTLSQADIITVICFHMASRYILPDQINEKVFPRLAAMAARAMHADVFPSTWALLSAETPVAAKRQSDLPA